jgi:esterase/lipase superfamily enzyme
MNRRSVRVAALLLVLAIGGCAAQSAPVMPPAATRFPIFYATNRASGEAEDPADPFGAVPAALAYGRAEIAIPVDHQLGVIESSASWGIADAAASEADFGVVSTAALAPAEFLAGVAEQGRRTGDGSVLVFIHGYNNSFLDALKRTAQLAADLDWQGPAVVFSWPSRGELLDFDDDRANAEASAAPLRVFLNMLANRSDAGRIDIVAHSMGARVLLLALAGFENSRRPFAQIALAAIEMSRDEFITLAPRAVAAAGRVTLYVSAGDMPLRVIAEIDGDDLAGDASTGPILLPGIDTVDATAADGGLLGHSYYADSRAVLADLHQLLTHDLPPDRRFGLRARTVQGGRYWELKS